MQEMFWQMNNLAVAKEDFRAVADGLKSLNNHLMKTVDAEKNKREELQKKYDECKKELKHTKKWSIMAVLALCFALIYSWI
ncbi:hypothetical protein LguiA_028121 [Lonicera macranthoides]